MRPRGRCATYTWRRGIIPSQLGNVHKAEWTELWTAVEDAAMAVYMCPKPTVFALAGNAPALSAVLALHADYRYAAEGTSVGLNEAQLDLVLPQWPTTITERLVGARYAERTLQQGTMFSAEAAEAIGFVDGVEPDYDAVTARAIAEAATLGGLWMDASADNKPRQHAPQVALIDDDAREFMWGQFSSARAQAQFAKFTKRGRSRGNACRALHSPP